MKKEGRLGKIEIQNGGHMSILLSIFLACGEKDHDHDTGADTAAEPSSEASTEPSGEASSEPAGEPSGEPVGDAANGESVVNSMCMGCHASNPDIEDSADLTDEELINLFDNGQGYMPAQNLTEQEKLDVIAYLRQEYGGGN